MTDLLLHLVGASGQGATNLMTALEQLCLVYPEHLNHYR